MTPSDSNRLTCFATCAPGLESILHQEVKELSLPKVERQVGGVRFEASRQDVWRANLWLRTPVRILARVARFSAPDEKALYEGALRVGWSKWLAPDGKLWIDAQTKRSTVDHSRFAAQRVKDAIVDSLRTKSGVRPSVDRDDYDLRVHLHLSSDRATLSVDTSGEPLHKRGWRTAQGRAPLAENLAAALVLDSGWDRRSPFLDPCCGSGTLLVEAAALAAGIPPGAWRKQFAFERLPGHDARRWQAMKEEAIASAKPTPKLTLVGYDRSPERVEQTTEHLKSIGFTGRAQVEIADARRFEPKSGWNGWIVSNLPYGERVDRSDAAMELSRRFGVRLREHASGYHTSLLVGGTKQADLLELPETRRSEWLSSGVDRVVVHAKL